MIKIDKKILKIRAFLMLMFVSLTAFSCIENDVPLPVVELQITDVKGDGFVVLDIDTKNQVANLILEEQTDIKNVNITDIEYTPQAKPSANMIGEFDMRADLDVTLSLYQDYKWKIRAHQDIPRLFKVDGQIGEERIDVSNMSATVDVAKGTDLSNINITQLKLGPEGITTISPAKEEVTDFSQSFRQVNVKYHDNNQEWVLTVNEIELSIILSKCDVWSTVAYLEASADTQKEHGFRYKRADSEDWIEVLQENIETNSGTFSTVIEGLTPEVEYQFMAYCGDDVTAVNDKSTQKIVDLENGNLEGWSNSRGYWLPSSIDNAAIWGTGNPGSMTAGVNITTPDTDIRPGSSGVKSAKLASAKVLGVKLAAGNLFIGKYVATKGTNGIVAFGTPFTSRPRALRGWVKYECGKIDNIGQESPPGVTFEQGVTNDEGMIYIALGTWTKEEYGVSSSEPDVIYGTDDSPLIVDTRDKNTFFSSKSDAVIAYGEVVYNSSVSDWIEFEIELDYNSTSKVPTHLIIVGSSSRYGDYFTGSSKSTMWLDDIELVY